MRSSPHPFTPGLAHRMWRLLPKALRRSALTQATSWLAPRAIPSPPPSRHGLTVGGELSQASGIGETARLMIAAAHHLGVPVWPVDMPPPVGARAEVPAQAGEPGGEPPPPGSPMVIHINAPMLPLALMRLPWRLPRHRRIIGYWAWELPLVPPSWAKGVRCVHEIWVPSAFTAEALEPLMPGRVRVVPPALAAVPPVPSGLARAAFDLPEDAVVVLVSLNLASSFERKNPLAAIAAFRAAFGERPDRVLVLKIGNPDHAPGDFARLAEAARAANIRVLTHTMSTADHAALIAASDIVLSLHRSEGLGLVPAEAMVLGKPVIATGWSGNMQFMDESSAALVRHTLVPAEDPRHVYRGAVWAEPDHDHAVEHLRRFANDPAERRALGARGQQMVRLRLGVAPLAAALRDVGLNVPA